jgi:hypothetical protein
VAIDCQPIAPAFDGIGSILVDDTICNDDILLLFCPTSQTTRVVIRIHRRCDRRLSLPMSGSVTETSGGVGNNALQRRSSPITTRRAPLSEFYPPLQMVRRLQRSSRHHPPSTVHGVVFDIFVVRLRKPRAGQGHRSLPRSEKPL